MTHQHLKKILTLTNIKQWYINKINYNGKIMIYLFNKLEQIRSSLCDNNKSFDKGIYAIRSSHCCHSTKKISTKVSRYPKVLNLI